ncbi:unnamed protein product [Brachionus calyciflorus]|uniref:Uncharacterized protein n=1 Tax=Brachionus calyciflorus TaxID=104777 RepID=A0A813XJ53_9BILA|nr:unnamed protein product [Brachionus calyciflorus]
MPRNMETQSNLENSDLILEYLKEFLDYIFQFYDSTNHQINIGKQEIQSFKQTNPKCYEALCEFNKIVYLSPDNLLDCISYTFIYIDKAYLQYNIEINLTQFYFYLKLVVTEGFSVNDEQLPMNECYDLLSVEIKMADLIKPKKNVSDESIYKSEKSFSEVKDNFKQTSKRPSILSNDVFKKLNDDLPLYSDSNSIKLGFEGLMEEIKLDNSQESDIQKVSSLVLDSNQFKKSLNDLIFNPTDKNNFNLDSTRENLEQVNKFDIVNDSNELISEADDFNNKSQENFLKSLNLVTNQVDFIGSSCNFLSRNDYQNNKSNSLDPKTRNMITKRIFKGFGSTN